MVEKIVKNNPWVFNGKNYNTELTKGENCWQFKLLCAGICWCQKKCHKWHSPKYFKWFVEKVPDESDLDFEFID